MILSFNLGGVHQLQKLYQFLYYKRLTSIQITTATTSEKQVYEPFADDQLSDVQNSRQSEHTKKVFCRWSLSTSLCEHKYSAFWTDVCQNFDFTRYIKQPSISASFLSRTPVVTATEFPPNVACFHRLPGKHRNYCTGLPSRVIKRNFIDFSLLYGDRRFNSPLGLI